MLPRRGGAIDCTCVAVGVTVAGVTTASTHVKAATDDRSREAMRPALAGVDVGAGCAACRAVSGGTPPVGVWVSLSVWATLAGMPEASMACSFNGRTCFGRAMLPFVFRTR